MKLLIQNKKSIMMLILQKLAFLAFIMCSFLLVRWCSLPVVDIPLLRILFLGEGEGGAIALGLVSGYVSGFFVFVLTVFLPSWKKDKPMQEQAAQKIYSIYFNTVLTLLIMYKGKCSKEEWSEISKRGADLECFTDDFYEKMASLDINSRAYTMILHKDDRSPLSWCEYLSEEAKGLSLGLNKIFLRYHPYLSKDLLRTLDSVMTTMYLEMFSGEFATKGMETTSVDDGFIYFDPIPLLVLCKQGNISPFVFSDTKLLKEYVSLLKELYQQLKKMPKDFLLKKDSAIEMLMRDNAGRLKPTCASKGS